MKEGEGDEETVDDAPCVGAFGIPSTRTHIRYHICHGIVWWITH